MRSTMASSGKANTMRNLRTGSRCETRTPQGAVNMLAAAAKASAAK